MNDIDSFAIRSITVVSDYPHESGMVYRRYQEGRGVAGLILVTSGELLYEFEGRSRKLKAGEAVLFPPTAAYVVKNVSSLPALHYSINFDCVDDPKREVWFLGYDADAAAENAREITRLSRAGDPLSQMRAIGLLYLLLSDLWGAQILADNERQSYHNMAALVAHIEERLGDKMDIASLASHLCMSETNFRRVFTQLFGISPMEYVIRRRLSVASEALIVGQDGIGKIAESYGFQSATYFCKLYRRRTGFTPGEVRRGEIRLEELLAKINRKKKKQDV